MHVLVIGAGVSGLGAAKFLRARGDRVRVSERARLTPERSAPYADLGVELCDGGHQEAHLEGIDLVVASPGLPPTHALLALARARGITIISEIDLALSAYRGSVIAVTGTNGKSTTCAMFGHVLSSQACDVAIGGNFGDPPTAILAEGRSPEWLVLELSSYQLEQSTLVSPRVAVFTSFSFDHLARHGSLANYLRAKWRVFDKLDADALVLMPKSVLDLARQENLPLPQRLTVMVEASEYEEGPGLPAHAEVALLQNGRLRVAGLEVDLAALGIQEMHNQLNAAFVLLGSKHVLNKDIPELAPSLRTFRGLPHRCELVGTAVVQGRPVQIINDSKSTNVESTLVALRSQKAPVILMAGGQGKGESYTPLLDESTKIAAAVTFGASGPEIAQALRDHVPVYEYPSLTAALAAIDGIIERYRCSLLFSPGCASFDEFQNYSQRGDVFKDALRGRYSL